ncbi:MAG: oxidoreductase [Promethearchaeota archaeon]
MKNFRNLSKPGNIGKMELKNRVIMAPMSTKLGTEEGAVNERIINFYAERAKGGVGLIIIENTCVEWPRGKAGTNPIRIDKDKYIQGLAEIAQAVHRYGAKISTQPQHTGRQTGITETEGQQLIAPSPVPCEFSGGYIPKEMTEEEIKDLIKKFVSATVRTKLAGFDAVEIHGAHGYIVNQFMSPFSNKRKDKYGGSLNNRMRFPTELIYEIRSAIGEDFPIIFRISASEFIKDGYTVHDAAKMAYILEKAGVDCIDIGNGIYESVDKIFPTLGLKPGCNVPYAKEIKPSVNIPISVCGRLGENLELADKIIENGTTDFVTIGRSLVADPYLVKKAFQNKEDEIRPCLGCNEACVGHQHRGWQIACQVNPEVGREKEFNSFTVIPKKNKKEVIVVGGGPGGIEAAVRISNQGHEVILYEKDTNLGGNLIPASIPLFKDSYKQYLKWLRNYIRKSNVKVNLGKECTKKILENTSSDIVIFATGGLPIKPDISGINKVENNILCAKDVLCNSINLNDEIVIIGGGRIGCELAWHLKDLGKKKVVIIEQKKDILTDVIEVNRRHIIPQLHENRVNILTKVNITQIIKNGIKGIDANGKNIEIFGDIVLACGYKPDDTLVSYFKKLRPNFPVYKIGDCNKIGDNIWGATDSAAWIAKNINTFINNYKS